MDSVQIASKLEFAIFFTFLGTEFFVTDMTRGRLSFQQRNFAGNRYSDHVAQLNAFQCWEEARQGGEDAEINFCDHKGKFTVWKNEKFTLKKKKIVKLTHKSQK